ncbi:hypothetical protein DO72_3398 [Burkholderia pseudomallei]|nr:hypothetical protein DO72_3398 [Burkholderia pseudomallei]
MIKILELSLIQMDFVCFIWRHNVFIWRYKARFYKSVIGY